MKADRAVLSLEVQAEAAAWIARLQAVGDVREVERGLAEWLKASRDHAAAFEEATDIWEGLGGVPTAMLLRSTSRPTPSPFFASRMPSLMAGAAACLGIIAVAGMLFLRFMDDAISTGVGEQRTMALADGSRVVLNTDSRIVVEPFDDVREVKLERGEVLFEVARDPKKPFVVVAGSKKVVAIGTAFVVRRIARVGGDDVSVTLIEGKVAVADVDVEPRQVAVTPSAQMLLPGQRLVTAVATHAVALIDQPRMDAVIAWKRGEVVLEDTPLRDAISEMNRYSPVELSFEGPADPQYAVSGVFRTGDTEAFARAVADIYGLEVARHENRITLSAKRDRR